MEYFNVVKRDLEDVTLDRDLSELKKRIDSRAPSIVRGLLSPEEAASVRAICNAANASTEPSNPTIESGTQNFHRIDENHPKSRVKSIAHGYLMFYWNPETAPVSHLFKRLFKLRNLLSDLPGDYALSDISDDGFISIPTVLQYPRGGGYMQEHKDPDVGQKFVISVCLSKIGEDFNSGGLYWRTPEGDQVWIDPLVQPGDALLFYPMDPHGIAPVDPDFDIDWSRTDGRWMMMSALVTLNSVQGKKDDLMAQGIGEVYASKGKVAG
ncbi:MAG TPA: hypothetical protein VIN57_00780 [Magnetovibrio sp.]